MKKFKEKKIVNVLNIITVILGISWFLSIVIGIFYPPFLLGFLLLPITIIPITIASLLSERKTYTRLFITYIENKINNATTLSEFILIQDEFFSLAVENKTYCLSFPQTLKDIHRNIISKIEILEKIK